MEVKLYKPEIMQDGLYTGKIYKIEQKEGKFGRYLRVLFDTGDTTIFPSAVFSLMKDGKLSSLSDLYKLLEQFIPLSDMDSIDIEKELVGKNVSFLVKSVESRDGSNKVYLDVVKGSIKRLWS